VAVGSQLNYCDYPANPPECTRPAKGPFIAGLTAWRFVASAGRAEHGGMADHPEPWRSPFSPVEMREMWTYSDGVLTTKGSRWPGRTARAGSWVLVDQATGNVQGVVPPGEFSCRFRPVDVFADVPALPAYLGTLTAPDGTALWIWYLIATPLCWLTGPGGWHGPVCSWCPAATATDGRRPRRRNWRPAERR
jgi:hypothetical protein